VDAWLSRRRSLAVIREWKGWNLPECMGNGKMPMKQDGIPGRTRQPGGNEPDTAVRPGLGHEEWYSRQTMFLQYSGLPAAGLDLDARVTESDGSLPSADDTLDISPWAGKRGMRISIRSGVEVPESRWPRPVPASGRHFPADPPLRPDSQFSQSTYTEEEPGCKFLYSGPAASFGSRGRPRKDAGKSDRSGRRFLWSPAPGPVSSDVGLYPAETSL